MKPCEQLSEWWCDKLAHTSTYTIITRALASRYSSYYISNFSGVISGIVKVLPSANLNLKHNFQELSHSSLRCQSYFFNLVQNRIPRGILAI